MTQCLEKRSFFFSVDFSSIAVCFCFARTSSHSLTHHTHSTRQIANAQFVMIYFSLDGKQERGKEKNERGKPKKTRCWHSREQSFFSKHKDKIKSQMKSPHP